jgi:flagellar motility protein MotE (MotC chaperone)
VKDKIVYIVAFLLAFILVTGALIYLNSMYKNIFKFDFTPESQAQSAANNQPNKEQNEQPKDSSSVNKPVADSLKQSSNGTFKDSSAVTLSDTNSMKKVKDKIAEVKKDNEQHANLSLDQTSPAIPKMNGSKKDSSTYQNWIKNTAKIYTSMDTKKAAKIIQAYSDNIARDILLTMKKKKAADILAEFKPEVATRIISAQR